MRQAWRLVTMLTASAIIARAEVTYADVIFTNFSMTSPQWAESHRTVNNNYNEAVDFVIPSDSRYLLDSVDVPLTGGTYSNPVFVSLMTSEGSVPGAIIETAQINNIDAALSVREDWPTANPIRQHVTARRGAPEDRD